ncbi:MAG: glycosyltransferase family 92 protein [Rickettsiales bacterium]|jgi:hypothetical protein|nr:glycosyltransferase family 92 protein [Rickettsiales bacterium]
MKKIWNKITNPFRQACYFIRDWLWRGTIAALRQLSPRRRAPRPGYLAICAIAKNEGPYFKEWIDFHRMLGVEKFIIYDNESTDNTREILDPYIKAGVVEYIFYPGMVKQLKAYNDCLKRHRYDFRWIAFIDLDEFLVPADGGTITAYLKKMERFSSVEINWLCYGSGGQKEKKPGFVIERFRDHSRPGHEINQHFKNIIDPARAIYFPSAHRAAMVAGKVCDSVGNPPVRTRYFWIKAPKNPPIIIAHYAVKSYGEFLDKRARGRARKLEPHSVGYFQKFDLNDVKNDPSMEKFVKALKKMERK